MLQVRSEVYADGPTWVLRICKPTDGNKGDKGSQSFAKIQSRISSFAIHLLGQGKRLFLRIVVCVMSLHIDFAPPERLVDLQPPVKAAQGDITKASADRKTDSCYADTWSTWLLRLFFKVICFTPMLHYDVLFLYIYASLWKLNDLSFSLLNVGCSLQILNARGTSTTVWNHQSSLGLPCIGSNIRRTLHKKLLKRGVEPPRNHIQGPL